MMSDESNKPSSCPVPGGADLSNLTVVDLQPDECVPAYRVAIRLADAEAQNRIGEHMLLSWYDRDRDFE